MLQAQQILNEFLSPLLEAIFAEVKEDWKINILEDRQDAPRPSDSKGMNLNYIYFRISSPKFLQFMRVNTKANSQGEYVENVEGQKEIEVVLNFLGGRANDMQSLFMHGLQAPSIYGSYMNYKGIQFFLTGWDDPEDMTVVEASRWIDRWQVRFYLNFKDSKNFIVDTIETVEITTTEEQTGISQKIVFNK